jgi:hypothetical protein
MKKTLFGLVVGLAIGSASVAAAASHWHANHVDCSTIKLKLGPGVICSHEGRRHKVVMSPEQDSIGTKTRFVSVSRDRILVGTFSGKVLWYGRAG